MNKRERLARRLCNWEMTAEPKQSGDRWAETDEAEREQYFEAVDAILDELMKPGAVVHAAFKAMDKATCHGDPKARAWDVLQGYRAILTAIKAGK